MGAGFWHRNPPHSGTESRPIFNKILKISEAARRKNLARGAPKHDQILLPRIWAVILHKNCILNNVRTAFTAARRSSTRAESDTPPNTSQRARAPTFAQLAKAVGAYGVAPQARYGAWKATNIHIVRVAQHARKFGPRLVLPRRHSRSPTTHRQTYPQRRSEARISTNAIRHSHIQAHATAVSSGPTYTD